MPKFTKAYIETLKAESNPYEVWDTELKGLGLRVQPSNRKTYYFLYRYKTSRKERLKIGVHGHITCEMAREIVRGWMGDLARGIDPKAKGKKQEAQKQEPLLFEDFWEMFTEKYISINHKPSTIRRNSSRIKKYILPFFRGKIISEINRQDMLAFQDKLSHLKGSFTKCRNLLHTAFEQAELWEYRDPNSNPCKGVAKFPDRKMERFLTAVELRKLEEILMSEAYSKTSPYSLAAIWMLIFTGCRASEIFTLQWKDVHLEDSYFYLKDSKVGVRAIPLNDKAKQILASLPQQEDNLYVFCGRSPGTHIQDVKRAWQKVRLLAGLPDVRLHDLRHSFASFALKEGVDLYTVSKLLGHKNITTTTRYAHLELEYLKQATNKVAKVFR